MFSFLDWPPFLVVIVCIAVGLGPALLLTWFTSRLPMETRAEYASVMHGSTVSSVALLFGLFAAFLANDIWVRNQTARQAVIDEGDAIRTLARLAEGQDPQHTEILHTALADYAKVVIEQDWPLMQQGKRSLELLARVRTISNLLITGPVGKNAGPVVQGKMLDAFVQLREKRQVRVIVAENRHFTIKWHAMVLFGLLTQLAITFAHLDRSKSMLLAHLVFASALSTCLSILLMNEFPFSQLNPISSDPIRTALASLYR